MGNEIKKTLVDFKSNEDAREIIGVKVTTSKKSKNKFYTYFCKSNFSNYELENADSLQGCSCESVGSSSDLGLNVGDIVEFNYGKSIGDYQPIKSVTMLSAAPFDAPVKDAK